LSEEEKNMRASLVRTLLCLLSLTASLPVMVAAKGGGHTVRLGAISPSAAIVEPDDGRRALIRYLDGAQRSIFVEAYILSDHSIMHALERAAAQGVRVDVLLERRPFGLGTFPEHIDSQLHAAGIAVRWSSPRFVFTHAKMIVIDDRVAIISTANFSRAAFVDNREVLIVDTARSDTRDLSNVFRADWDRLPPTFHSPDLVISPSNARRDLESFVSRAHSSIEVYAEELQDPGMERVLSARVRSHVRVRVLLPPSALSGPRRPGMSLVRRLGVRALASPYIHAKVIVVDGSRAFVGSENLSSTSLDRNREIGLFIRGPVVSRLHGVFGLDWRRARSP
jgi:cardiolipin synthase A/B